MVLVMPMLMLMLTVTGRLMVMAMVIVILKYLYNKSDDLQITSFRYDMLTKMPLFAQHAFLYALLKMRESKN